MSKFKDEIIEKVDGIKYRYSAEWTNSLETEKHWRLYWQQVAMMQDIIKPGEQVLEIGVGSGFTANYLRSKGINVTTMDIDKRKDPDIVANIVTHDWSEEEYDHILAFEVFEHIPFKEFNKVLNSLSSVCNGHLFFSVPKAERVLLSAELRLPILGQHTLKLAIPHTSVSTEYHFWEVGIFNTPKKTLHRIVQKNGFQIKDDLIRFSRYYISASSLSN